MSIPNTTLWDIEPHTVAKHEILRRYLGAWFAIQDKYNPRIVYLDGFCGPGRYRGGEPGSPLIALDVAINHRKGLSGELVFWFVDVHQDRIDHLKKELGNLQTPKHFIISADCGRFDKILTSALDALAMENAAPAPTFAFIDPFGFSGIPFRLIERLLSYPKCEVFITFMADSVNRWLILDNPVDRNHLKELLGTEEIECILSNSTRRIEQIRDFYQAQLKSAARFVRYFEMRNEINRPIYYLFFASNNRLGHVKMKEAMWRVDSSGIFCFSDATDPKQHVIFNEPDLGSLRDDIRRHFGNQKGVDCREICLFTEDDTAFIRTHMNAVLAGMESDKTLLVNPLKADGSKRRKGSFPDGVLVDFVNNLR